MSKPFKVAIDRITSVKGVRDLLPAETDIWSRVEQIAHEVFGSFGFSEIRLPIFEAQDLFKRSVGLNTDIVSKEMYTFTETPLLELGIFEFPSGNLDQINLADEVPRKTVLFPKRNPPEVITTAILALRPEATASVCRAYIEHNMQQLPQPVKLYYMGPMFRREKPQKGRHRQFYQIGAEVLGGNDSPSIDAELIQMLMFFFGKAGLEGTTLYINSIGHNGPDCRGAYVAKLRDELEKVKGQLGQDSQRRIQTNPLRVLDSKLETEQPVIEKLPRIGDYLCDSCRQNYVQVKRELQLRCISYEENWRLVRGLDYYMRTTFEVTARGLGSQDAICGGGRYDGLVELLGGPPTKGIGFAIGEDRLVLALQHQGVSDVKESRFDLIIVATSDNTWDDAIRLSSSLRRRGLKVFLPETGTRLKKAMDIANRAGIRVAIIVGDDEVRGGKYGIRILQAFDDQAAKNGAINIEEARVYGSLVKLRNDLERKLRSIASDEGHQISPRGLSSILGRVQSLGLLPASYANHLADVIPILNRAIHGESLTAGSRDWVQVAGNLLLIELDKLGSKENDDSGLT